MKSISLGALLALVLVTPAFGGGGGHHGAAAVQHIFETADADGDGSLSESEYSEAGLERFGVSFEASDSNGDGRTTLPEYLELYDRHHGGAERVRL